MTTPPTDLRQQPAQPCSGEVKRYVGRITELEPCPVQYVVLASDFDRLQSALAAAQQRIATMRARLLDQAREFMREQRTTFQLGDDTYHRDLGLLADFVAHVAGVCKRCHGSKLVTISNHDGNGSDADDQPCPDCLDIRELLPRVTP